MYFYLLKSDHSGSRRVINVTQTDHPEPYPHEIALVKEEVPCDATSCTDQMVGTTGVFNPSILTRLLRILGSLIRMSG